MRRYHQSPPKIQFGDVNLKNENKKKTFEIYDSNMTNMICVLKYKIGVCRRRRTCN